MIGYPLVAATVGLAIGSLFDILFGRAFRDQPLRGPIYRCNVCRSPFRVIYAIPVVGVLTTGVRCWTCRAPLPPRALILPLGAAALFVGATVVFGSLSAGLLGGIFATLFLALVLTDIDRRLLPNRLVYPGILLAVGLCWAWPDKSAVDVLLGGAAAAGIALTLLLLSIPFGVGAFGMGDAKMIVLMGFVLGMPSLLVGLFIGTVAAALFAVILVAAGLRARRDYIAHGPFLAAGGVIALFWGLSLWHFYSR